MNLSSGNKLIIFRRFECRKSSDLTHKKETIICIPGISICIKSNRQKKEEEKRFHARFHIQNKPFSKKTFPRKEKLEKQERFYDIIDKLSLRRVHMANEKITKQGKLDLEQRLEELNEEKKRVKVDLNLARSQGDLSENADYDAAREKLQEIETQISKIQYTLDHATIIDNVSGGDRVAKIGGETIHTTNLSTGKTYDFVIVGSAEAKPKEGKISNTCPVALAVLGKEAGDVVEIEVSKPYKLRIDKIGK